MELINEDKIHKMVISYPGGVSRGHFVAHFLHFSLKKFQPRIYCSLSIGIYNPVVFAGVIVEIVITTIADVKSGCFV